MKSPFSLWKEGIIFTVAFSIIYFILAAFNAPLGVVITLIFSNPFSFIFFLIIQPFIIGVLIEQLYTRIT